jgi:hypothetical protein
MQREAITVGRRVRKRGMAHLGTVDKVSDSGWARVAWDDGVKPKERPRLCTFRELECVEDAPR